MIDIDRRLSILVRDAQGPMGFCHSDVEGTVPSSFWSTEFVAREGLWHCGNTYDWGDWDVTEEVWLGRGGVVWCLVGCVFRAPHVEMDRCIQFRHRTSKRGGEYGREGEA